MTVTASSEQIICAFYRIFSHCLLPSLSHSLTPALSVFDIYFLESNFNKSAERHGNHRRIANANASRVFGAGMLIYNNNTESRLPFTDYIVFCRLCLVVAFPFALRTRPALIDVRWLLAEELPSPIDESSRPRALE